MKVIRLSEMGNRPSFQGELAFLACPIDEGAGADRLDTNVIAHSETGHHHLAQLASVFELDPMVMFLQPDGSASIDGVPYVDIVHNRSFDQHETIRLLYDAPNTKIKILRQRERTPEGWRRVED